MSHLSFLRCKILLKYFMEYDMYTFKMFTNSWNVEK